ncbi:Pls/PosA family non-ribosomal peptide synthetase [Amycolatopsis suaedae]|uniref:Amino acid adenylation domain-containing protein n=1 Tax=Amycolatopsis suaedae TaxID=2510978 RepID=A0A4Q7J465_9PSEU|nr:Pls/PosA family non-ribosomal peptide synthetase [Amycolatopsis suaedae]RZQ62330.1 amino acid adenylation domain-containing protein [Amycolatopsis suaedae]
MHHVFEHSADRVPDAVAVEVGDEAITYAELDRRANRLAHHLRASGIRNGARVAILVERSAHTYVCLLGIGKAGAVFVPIDPASPADRIAYITDDSRVDLLLTTGDLAERAGGAACTVLDLDAAAADLAACPASRPDLGEDDLLDPDPSAYIIYTSGSSGRPKGVEVAQRSICNFLDIVPGLYDVRPDDRVYQGMTISFDFSIEEIWPTWAVGATLVAGPDGSGRLGAELAEFLDRRRITVLYCVPTLLATIPHELPLLRNLLVGGEACPRQLVDRWARDGRRILNTYGPTEATVTATWCELLPGRPVTIGVPVPTYTVFLLDDDRERVPDGEVGEICIGGPGVAKGYVGRPELTADRFIEHPLAPGGRLYRTGDLGRVSGNGEIEYLGRADAEVKIRGHRVDLGEIESVLLADPGVSAAAAAMVEVTPGSPELVGYVVSDSDDEDGLFRRLRETLRDQVPAYMVPAFFVTIPVLPMMPSGKVDRRLLPAPAGARRTVDGPVVAPAGATEELLTRVWAEVFGLAPEELSVTADFFADLGGHSLLAATVTSRLREHETTAGIAVRDLYAHPDIRALAAYLDSREPATAPAGQPRYEPLRHGTRRIAAAGSAQALVIYLLLLVITLPVAYVYTWNDGDVSVPVLAELLVAILISYLGVRWVVPLVVVRPLSAGIKPGRYRLWGPTYLRLWTLDLLLSVGPLPVVSGSGLMPLYLRLLGARVGRHAVIATSSVALPALVRIGDDAAIGYGAVLRPWRVEDGWVTVGEITVGAGAFVGANAVLEPGCSIGPGAALGEQSMLGRGESVPAGQRWSGSPAAKAGTLSPTVEDLLGHAGPTPGWRFHQLLLTLVGLGALEIGAICLILPSVALVWWALLGWGVLAGAVATMLAGPVFVLTVCAFVAAGRRLVLPRTPVGVHPVRSGLGVRKWVADKLLEFSLTFTNSLYATLYTVPWLRLLGARVGRGAEVSTAGHLDPDLLTLGSESFVADMATVGAATFARGRVAFLTTEVGRRAFVGNASVVPAGTELGEGSLVGVGTVPPGAHVPRDSSWLGSPAIHLPRRQDSGDFPEEQTFRPPRKVVWQRLGIEFARATLPASLLGLSFYLFLLVLSGLAFGRDLPVPALVSPLVAIASGLAVIAFCAATKRNVVGEYTPRVEPLWSPFVRRSEFVTGLYESAAVPAGLGMLVGTPLLPPLLRWFGARIGRRTWIGTTYLTEFDLVRVGDDATVGTEVSLQTHLFEDRVMKMSVVTVGDGATVGTRAIVLYDAVVGDGVSLGSLSLLMKGEHLASHTSWRGIPAQVTALPAAGVPA